MSAIKFMKTRNDLKLTPSWRLHLDESNYINKALCILFGNLTYPTLCTCAIVSKTWRKTALDELQSRCTVNVNNNDQIRIVLKKLNEPLTFKVGKCIIASPFTNNMLVQQMLTQVKVATTLNVLKIESTDIQEAFLFRILANLPNLTQLSVVLLQISSKTSNQDYDEHPFCTNFNFPFLSGPLTNPLYSTYESKKCVSQRISDESQPITSTGNSCKVNGNGAGTSPNKENELFVHHSIRHLHFDMGQSGRLQLSKIFHTFPNLVELNVSNIVEEPRKNFKYQQHPDSSRHMKCTLKCLSIRQYSNIGYSEKLVLTLMKLGMRLAKLVLIFPPPSSSSHKTLQVSSAPLKQFIEMQGSTLKSLKLIQVEDDLCSYNYSECDKNTRVTSKTENIPSKSGDSANAVVPRLQVQVGSKYWWNFNYSSPSFPLLPIHLPNLEVLHVQKPLITNVAQVLNHFPKLSQLSIQVSPSGATWRSMFPQKLEAHVQISTFKLDFIDSDSLSRLGYCFPALQFLQMSYCDESLFNTLCKLIPCFNGKVAKENLVPCEQCHEKSEQGKINKEVDAVKNRPLVQASCRQNGERFQLLDEQCSSATGITRMKNLKLLRVRPCHHFSYENFVFLQNGTSDTTHNLSQAQSFGLGENKFGNTSGNVDLDSSFGFSWSSLDIMRDKEFAEFPVDFSENAESCSSA